MYASIFPYRVPHQRVKFDFSPFFYCRHRSFDLVIMHAVQQHLFVAEDVSSGFLIRCADAKRSSENSLVLVLDVDVGLCSL